MGYGFSDVEAALAAIHHISDDKRSAFANRLKHIQRLGFPPGVNTGRGRAAVYAPEHAFLLAVVLQLGELGITPERAIGMISSSYGELARGVLEADAKANNQSGAVLCEMPALSLQEMIHQDRATDHMGIWCITDAEAIEMVKLVATEGGPIRFAAFSLSGVIWRLSNHLPEYPGGFHSSLKEWARETMEDMDG